MRQTGFAELSGLCTHPDFQRRGLGALLFHFAAGEIAACGETVYLHAYITNAQAIALLTRWASHPLGDELVSRQAAAGLIFR